MSNASNESAEQGHAVINDCWNKIGVQGDLSCPELVQHIHCRNCPIYSAAAAVLLDSDLPAGFVEERTQYFVQPMQSHTRDTRSLAIFRIGSEWLALPTSALVEVADMRPLHTLPHRKGGVVLGLVNVRGELLICVSLSQLLGIGKTRDTSSATLQATYRRLLVIEGEGGRLVFPIDEMHGVHRFNALDLQAVPVTLAKSTATYATALLSWQNRSVGCLDDQLIFYTLNRSLA